MHGPGADGRGQRAIPASGASRRTSPAASRRAMKRFSTRAASCNCSRNIMPATRPKWSRKSAAAQPEQLITVAETLCQNSGRERTSAIVYAVGWTQHSTGVQMIRAAGHHPTAAGQYRPARAAASWRCAATASIQGSTDIPTLYDLLPGYLPQPLADKHHETLDGYVEYEGLPTGYWVNYRKFIVSLLKAWYGDGRDAAE